MHTMAKGVLVLLMAVLLVAVAAAAVVSSPERESGLRFPGTEDEDLYSRVARMEKGEDKSTVTDIMSSIGTQVASATDQAILMTGQFFNSAFGGFSNFIEAIKNFLTGKPIVATTTNEDGSGSVVFLVHSKPNI